jgi:hypothetical protein
MRQNKAIRINTNRPMQTPPHRRIFDGVVFVLFAVAHANTNADH